MYVYIYLAELTTSGLLNMDGLHIADLVVYANSSNLLMVQVNKSMVHTPLLMPLRKRHINVVSKRTKHRWYEIYVCLKADSQKPGHCYCMIIYTGKQITRFYMFHRNAIT